jgi:bleomycin hydrolase
MFKLLPIIIVFISILPINSNAQKRDKGKFIEYNNPYWDEIKQASDDFNQEKSDKKLSFKMDFSGYELPQTIDEFDYQWHNKPVSQGWTGTCWSFSATSFLESEIKRINDKEIKLSEMYTVYWEYVEKARRFVKERGNSLFAEGSQASAVTRMFKKYGCVPEQYYTGKLEGQEHHDHHIMFKEMKTYLDFVKETNFWNEQVVLQTIKEILNNYLGTPPSAISVNGKTMSPMEYFESEVKLNLDDYVNIMSLLEPGYWKQVVYDVPDNWWKDDSYYNVPLNDFMNYLIKSVENKYTVFIGGDVSESGYYSFEDVAMVPSYDIPSDYIDEYSRQFRFSNKTTTDDHGIHLVGYKKSGDDYWFMIKDSGSGSKNGDNWGYYFYHYDYIKLKMMNYMVHKDAVKELLEKFD